MPVIYVVTRGRNPGYYYSWPAVEEQINGYKGCVFKKFDFKQYGGESNAFAAAYCEYNKNSKRIYYAVTEGKAIGIFLSKEHCDAQLKDCHFQRYKTFSTIEEAAEFIQLGLKEKQDSLNTRFPVESKRVDFQRLRQKKYGPCDFYVDENGFVQAFTDGSCSNNGKKGAKAGAGVSFGRPGHEMEISTAVTTEKQSNNVGELFAVREALRVAKRCDIKKLMIHSDSKYVIQCFSYWVKDWAANRWVKKATGKPVENKELIEEIFNMIRAENIEIKWNHVPAHRGIPGNEHADRLAKAGAAGIKPANQLPSRNYQDVRARNKETNHAHRDNRFHPYAKC